MGTEQAIMGKNKPITLSNKLAWRSFGQLAWRSLDAAGMAQLGGSDNCCEGVGVSDRGDDGPRNYAEGIS